MASSMRFETVIVAEELRMRTTNPSPVLGTKVTGFDLSVPCAESELGNVDNACQVQHWQHVDNRRTRHVVPRTQRTVEKVAT